MWRYANAGIGVVCCVVSYAPVALFALLINVFEPFWLGWILFADVAGLFIAGFIGGSIGWLAGKRVIDGSVVWEICRTALVAGTAVIVGALVGLLPLGLGALLTL